ncbi:HlyD family efflux transporter periplasmic adaptor subunit [Noviherbaspirillum sp. 1P10PC]|uniref:HlyD family efflux transporter periplasmic adaptor subunit n=1 Tax=Noviherbaspirillum sp. 1P10PC TaxID=3132292 RepID=UPI00399FD5C1
MLSHASFEAAAADFATRLAVLFQASRVSIGLLNRGVSRVVAVSHGVTVDYRRDLMALIAAAMDEAIDQAASVVYPDVSTQPRIVMAHAALVSRHGGSAVSVPVVDAGCMVGAVTLERHGQEHFTAADETACVQVLQALSPVLFLKRSSERSLAAHAAGALGSAKRSLMTANPARKIAAALAAMALLATIAVPVPYRIHAPVRLEGAVQRVLTAPDDGYIQQVEVRPGDPVKGGQTLAQLAQQDLQLERSKAESELAQYESSYGMALAQADRSMLVSYQAKASGARSRIDLISRQIERSYIVAPFDGVVISGDLSQSLGAPVQKGNPLLVIAPHDSYRLIVEVDERDIADLGVGAAGRVRLTALPNQSMSFAVERIAPVAVSRDGRHFFEAEGRLDSNAAAIRPGLEGIARIDAPERSLASILGHRIHAWLRLSLWSLGWWS